MKKTEEVEEDVGEEDVGEEDAGEEDAGEEPPPYLPAHLASSDVPRREHCLSSA